MPRAVCSREALECTCSIPRRFAIIAAALICIQQSPSHNVQWLGLKFASGVARIKVDGREARSVISMIKKRIKSGVKRLRLWYDTFLRPFDPSDLENALLAAGVRPGDALFVHSSYDAFGGFRGRPSDVIAILQNLVGEHGMIMMPTMPFTGTALDYAISGSTFDVRRTPSRMGLVTELFRRSLHVTRSAHPTHPIAIWGRDAAKTAERHAKARTPCGRDSPFERLVTENGKIILLGTGIEAVTFFHFVEEQIEDVLPFSPFTAEMYSIDFVDSAGKRASCETRLFDPTVSRRRRIQRIVPELRRSRALQVRSVGRLRFTVLNARDVLDATRRLVSNGTYPYE
jgi:aminoglycoside 3-N-acetyltransferase